MNKKKTICQLINMKKKVKSCSGSKVSVFCFAIDDVTLDLKIDLNNRKTA